MLNYLHDAHSGHYHTVYQLPAYNPMGQSVTVNDNLIGYKLYWDKCFAATKDADEVLADYTFRADEATFPAYFTLAVTYSLAIPLALSIARDASLANAITQQAIQLMAKARSIDAQQQTTRKLVTSRFITNKRSKSEKKES